MIGAPSLSSIGRHSRRRLDSWITRLWRSTARKTLFAKERPDVVVLRTNPKDSSLARLVTVLVKRYNTTAIIWDRTNNYSCPVRSSRVNVHRSTLPGEYYRFSTLVRVALLQPWFLWSALRTGPRVVHAMDLDTGIIGLLAARLLRVPFVYECLDPYAASLPNGWPPCIARVVQRIENAVISASDLFVITDLMRMPQHSGASPRKVVELPNIPMVSLESQRPSEAGLVVGYIGHLVPHRSLDVIVDTVGRLATEGVTLQLGGFGPLEDALRRRASAFSNVTFLGWVDDDVLMSKMSSFDVFVQIEDPQHPAYRWVSPNKVFDSMALGRPIVVAAGTLAADRVAESGHGITVRYRDSGDLRRTLLELRDDPELRASLGAAGRRTFNDCWAPDVVTSRVLAGYPVSRDCLPEVDSETNHVTNRAATAETNSTR